jgi:hypothetical protein
MIRPELWKDVKFQDRFWSSVVVRGPSECWPWLGKTVRGRGSVSYQGTDLLAPRVAKAMEDRAWPADGLFACHSCDNPNCVNPEHLWWGTALENNRDASRKGRLKQAPASHCSNGHEMSEGQFRFSKSGHRVCRLCAMARQRRWKASKPPQSGGAKTPHRPEQSA